MYRWMNTCIEYRWIVCIVQQQYILSMKYTRIYKYISIVQYVYMDSFMDARFEIFP